MDAYDASRFRVENITPVLNVKNIAASLAFYVDVMGFKNAEWGDENFTSIYRDNTSLYLCRQGQGSPGTWVWMGFDGDIDQLHDYLKANAVNIKMPPTNFSWAMEMHIEDPDGHVLRFGTDPDPKKPFADK